MFPASGQAADLRQPYSQPEQAGIPQVDRLAPYEDRVYFSWLGRSLPDCDSGRARRRAVARQVSRAVPSYYGSLEIINMEDVRETNYGDRPTPVGRRYCDAQAIMSDDTHRRVYYTLVQYDGFLGLSWGVRACVDGLDKFRIYDGDCRALRPEQDIIPR